MRAFGVVSRGKVLDAAFLYHSVYLGLVAGLAVVYTYGVSSVAVYKLHTGNIRIAVSDIYHIPKRYAYVLGLKVFIYARVVHVENSL